jgi:Arc/MetJ-type ribon-helix-helix transcriptional regulator
MQSEPIEIFLPDELRAFAEAQVREHEYDGLADYLQALVRAERKRVAREKFDQALELRMGTRGET